MKNPTVGLNLVIAACSVLNTTDKTTLNDTPGKDLAIALYHMHLKGESVEAEIAKLPPSVRARIDLEKDKPCNEEAATITAAAILNNRKLVGCH